MLYGRTTLSKFIIEEQRKRVLKVIHEGIRTRPKLANR